MRITFGKDYFGIYKSVFNCLVAHEDGDLITVIGCCCGSANCATNSLLRCDGNLVSPPGQGWSNRSALGCESRGGIDLDIDNDNNNGTFGGPNHTLEEDRWESADKNDKGEKLPGNLSRWTTEILTTTRFLGFADFGRKAVLQMKIEKNHFVPQSSTFSNGYR